MERKDDVKKTNEIIDDLCSKLEKRGEFYSQKTIKEFEEIAIKSKSPKLAYTIANYAKKYADVETMGKIVLESKHRKYNIRFAIDIEGANVLAHQRVIEQNPTGEYLVSFAKIKGADVNSIAQKLAKLNEAKWICYALLNFKGLNKDTKIVLEEGLAKTHHVGYITIYRQSGKAQNKILFDQTVAKFGTAKQILEYENTVKVDDFKVIEDAIAKANNAFVAFEHIKSQKNADVARFAGIIRNSSNKVVKAQYDEYMIAKYEKAANRAKKAEDTLSSKEKETKKDYDDGLLEICN